ncbi:hypothetical protein GCM10023238_06590 [Streptomyces heliomycini]
MQLAEPGRQVKAAGSNNEYLGHVMAGDPAGTGARARVEALLDEVRSGLVNPRAPPPPASARAATYDELLRSPAPADSARIRPGCGSPWPSPPGRPYGTRGAVPVTATRCSVCASPRRRQLRVEPRRAARRRGGGLRRARGRGPAPRHPLPPVRVAALDA